MNDKLKELYEEILAELDPQTVGETGVSVLPTINDICENYELKTVLEIGFNRGSSALSFLLSNEKLKIVSIDIRNDVQKSVDVLNEKFSNRLEYISMNSANLLDLESKGPFDLVFIDGDHSREAINRDTKNSIKMNIPLILFDDYFHSAHGPDVKSVIEENQLTILKEYPTHCGQCLTKQGKIV